MASRVALMALFAACGDPPARVQLVPVDLGDCGKPSRGALASMEVRAYTATGELPRAVSLDATGRVDISDFPADTLQLGVELYGNQGLVAAGKTAPLAFGSLANGAQIPIAVLPLEGFCSVGPLTEPRVAPMVARAGDGVLVAGGTSLTGTPLATAEYYDPASATFTAIDVPTELDDPANGLAGGVLTELSDGRVALTGTAAHALVYFDPKTMTFGDPVLFDHRAFHGALEIAPNRLFVIGGCAEVVAGACSGPALHSSFTYHLDDLAMRDSGPVLPDGSLRAGATMFDIGLSSFGKQLYLLAGGNGDAGAADRFALDDAETMSIAMLDAQVAELDGGVAISAFAPDALPASGVATQLAPEGPAPEAIAPAMALSGARLVALEDGSVLAVGGDATGGLSRYVATVDAWQSIAPPSGPPTNAVAPGALAAPALVRLADGSVLVIAGAGAWLYRPSLVGANTGLVEVEPDGSTPGVLIPLDPAAASHAGGQLVVSGPAIVGGFRATAGKVNAAVHITGDHVQLIGQFLGPGRALVGDLQSGAPARVMRLDGGTSRTICTGQDVPDLTAALSIGLEVDGNTAVLSVATLPLATCDLSSDADSGDVGAWGISALDGTQVTITTLTVQR